MAEQSEITSSDLAPVTEGATVCDKLEELAATRSKFATFLDWIVSDPSGNLATDFKTAIARQILFDADKKGYLVMSDETTGYLTLVQKLLLAKLSVAGVTAGDYLIATGTGDALAWAKQTPIYAAPTVGGSTVPAVSSGGVSSVAHGFSAAPKNFRCFLECNSTDIGYAVGDRVDASGLILLRDAGGEQMNAVTIGCDGTLLFAVFQVRSGAGGEYRLVNKSTFARAAIDPSKWNVQFWALP